MDKEEEKLARDELAMPKYCLHHLLAFGAMEDTLLQ